jgi:hypothetical protein
MVTAHGLDEASMDLTMTTRAVEIALPFAPRRPITRSAT